MIHLQKKTLFTLLAAILLTQIVGQAFALSSDDVFNLVSLSNNFIKTGESVSAIKITDNGIEYWIAIASVDSKPTAYIPIKNTNGEIESSALKARNLIKTAIVKRGIDDLRASYSLNWNFSTYNKSEFSDAAKEVSGMPAKALTVKTELEKISDNDARKLVTQVDALGTLFGSVANQSDALSKHIEEAMAFEDSFLSKPETGDLAKYEKYHDDFFLAEENLKNDYSELNTKISDIQNGISALKSLDISTKNMLNSNLDMPVGTRSLDSIFSSSSIIKDQINGVFNSAGSADNFYATLQTRVKMNEAWQLIYNNDAEISKANSQLPTLEKAAQNIFSDDYITSWSAQAEVAQLQTNWKNTETNYNGGRYEEAKLAATKAKKNVLEILKQGIPEAPNGIPQEILIQVIAVLAVVLVALFIADKFYFKKKKEEGEEKNEEEY
ncbi:MAG: hypothetical protein WC308_00955 [archaeon]